MTLNFIDCRLSCSEEETLEHNKTHTKNYKNAPVVKFNRVLVEEACFIFNLVLYICLLKKEQQMKTEQHSVCVL